MHDLCRRSIQKPLREVRAGVTIAVKGLCRQFGYMHCRCYSELGTQLVQHDLQPCTSKGSSLKNHFLMQPGTDQAQQMIWLTQFETPLKSEHFNKREIIHTLKTEVQRPTAQSIKMLAFDVLLANKLIYSLH